jgi:hypothetical protein
LALPKQAEVDFKRKLVRRDKEVLDFILIKEAIYQEEINIFLDLETQMDSNTVVVGDFNTPLSPIDRSSRQKNQHSNSRIK